MQSRSGSQIREDFLRFFEEKRHRRVHSSSLVPANDPTLLFTNAGMNQFKDVFLGAEHRAYTRAASSQKCVRAGGKHNDLENVGFTRRHHTFFEMLGNFSFGDYFKREAIAYAWELLTSPHWFGIDPARLYITIFEGNAAVPRDDEAEQFWIETGVPANRIFGMSAKDNFWQMGDTGPCGPCSEIFYDLGLAAAEAGPDGQKIDKPFPHDDQRYVEIWNLVFMQFDRVIDHYNCLDHAGTVSMQPFLCLEDHPDEEINPVSGLRSEAAVPIYRLDPLPKRSIDTGMGLERIACVLQGVLSNYQTDLFTPLISAAGWLTKFDETLRLPAGPDQDWTSAQIAEVRLSKLLLNSSLRIIADHGRAATFLISDGVEPSNEGRGYVLRKILRRAIRHGRALGQNQPFMFEMVKAVREHMKSAYPELIASAEHVSKVVLAEEEQFARVIASALTPLDEAITASKLFLIESRETSGYLDSIRDAYREDVANRRRTKSYEELDRTDAADIAQLYKSYRYHVNHYASEAAVLEGSAAFRLYETYGLPKDFIIDACRDADVRFDDEGFEQAKAEEQARARASWKGGSQKSASPVYRELPKTDFEGYTATRIDGARILALVKEGAGVQSLQAGEEGEAVLNATSFYADSGGQVGDVGWLYAPDHQTILAEVKGATRPIQGVFAHRILARQSLAVGDEVDTVVNAEVRNATMRNHTGTHLLHAALRQVLGTHVKQAGSLVNQSRLRFDFSHFTGVAEPELAEIESIVNRQVLANTPVQTMVDVPIDVAVNELGAMALFGEKYGDRVRVVKIGDFSTELCGGTHTAATGELGLIKLIGESSVASGVRRVEALSGTGALEEFRRGFEVARVAGGGAPTNASSPAEALRERLAHNDDEIKRLRRELDQLKLKSAQASIADAASGAVEVQGIKVLARRVDGVDKAQMRDLVDQLRTKLGSGIVVLGASHENKVTLIVGVTKDLTARVQAGKIVATLAAMVGGKGGGRPDLAEAGGSDPIALDATLAQVPTVVKNLLA